MGRMIPAVLVSVLLASTLSMSAEAETTSNTSAPPLPVAAFDSPAQAAARKLIHKTSNGAPPKRPAVGAKVHPDLVIRLEEILVYGRNEPEDYVGPKFSPLMQFRARLENDVPLSPAKKAQRVLCFIGLCSSYGPEGIPLGDSPERRAEARLIQSTIQLNGRFYGTLQ